MSIFRKIGMFLSSFTPLFFLMVVKEIIEILNKNWTFNLLNTSLLIIITTFIIYGCLTFYFSFSEVKQHKGKEIKIIQKQNITDQHFLGYFSIFVLFAVSFQIQMCSMALIFFIVLTFIAIVYIKNDFYYINPLINLLGYSFYDIQYVDQNGKTFSTRIFFKGKLKLDCSYILKSKYSSFMFVKEKV